MFRRDDRTLGRRKFLRALGSVSTAAVATATVSMTATEEAQAYDPGNRETRARYRADSPDVQAFYRTNGYETLKT
ncbi:MAG TPA: formate dehydrogenase [Alphaproteobacteria bacterium]